MPVIHQSGGGYSKGMFYETPDSPDYRGACAENDLLPASITDLLGLDISRGQLVSPGSPGAKAPGSTWSNSHSTPPLPSPQMNDDPPSFPLDMSALKSGRGLDMFSTSACSSGMGGMGSSGMGSSSSSMGSGSHGAARAIRGSPPYRLNSVGSNCSSPTLEQALLLNCGMGSRSNSPADSDTSGVSSLDSNNLTELVNRLSLGHGHSNYAAQQQGCLSPSIQQDLNTLTNLQALQSLSNRARIVSLLQSYNQQQSGNQQSASAPVSPISVDRKPWTGSSGGPNSDVCGNNLLPVCLSPCSSPFDNDIGVDQLAFSNRYLRNAAASLCDTTCTWSGTLPPRIYDNPSYSVKVFLGGVPWDINEATLVSAFKQFGPIRVEWPGKDQAVPQPKGYVYIIFECEKQVKALLQACTKNYSNGAKNWYYKISSKRMKAKEVQVIPWMTSDTNYVKYPSQRLEPERTVFVGALHGMLNAHGLATIMDDLFKGVVYAGIDIDKHKYPTGAGRVTFDNHRSFIRAVLTAFIEVKTSKFTKKIQVDPYLEDSPCSVCNVQQGPYFCREINCFRYFCRGCWHLQHSLDASMHSHKAMSRDFKSAKLGAMMAPRTPSRLKYSS